MDIVIRAAHPDEVILLGAIERDGDRRYRGYAGVPEGFDDVAPLAQLRAAQADGRLWVGSAPHGELAGFALVEPVDGNAHLEQVSVRLALQGQGVGRLLIAAVCAWARDHAMTAVTLCTFSDVSWNQAFYEHLGFVVLSEERWTPGLRAVFESDAHLGLDLSRRVVMGRAVVPGRA